VYYLTVKYINKLPKKFKMSDTLLLNADAQPVSLLPLSTISWQDAIRYLVLEKVEVLAWHEDWIVRSANWQTRVPAIVILKEYFKKKTYVRLTKRNVFLRDEYLCQYCGIECGADATLDHVIPFSKGGRSTWDNLSTACKHCNYLKADKTKMKPKRKPYRPDYWELTEKRRKFGFHMRHPSWADYLNT
jgi:5-methylcytosine-specific restriction endonuclease McrA